LKKKPAYAGFFVTGFSFLGESIFDVPGAHSIQQFWLLVKQVIS
jgi:hypothetical protein